MADKVRAKFTCESVNRTKDGGSVHLEPVYSGSEENEQFYKYTPGGKVDLSTVNESALDFFVPGKEYYLDFTPAT